MCIRPFFHAENLKKQSFVKKHANESERTSLGRRFSLPLPITALLQVLDTLTSTHKTNTIPETTFAPSSIFVNPEERLLYTAVL